jgi:hypothetical protein
MLSKTRTLVYSIAVSFSVLLVSTALQWLVYDDWLHQTGPFHIVGSSVAAAITFAFVFRWFRGAHERAVDAQRRFEIIAQANDRIRNRLQTIECLTYASDRDLADGVREAIDDIDAALRGIIEGSRTNQAPRSVLPPVHARSVE